MSRGLSAELCNNNLGQGARGTCKAGSEKGTPSQPCTHSLVHYGSSRVPHAIEGPGDMQQEAHPAPESSTVVERQTVSKQADAEYSRR